MSYRADNALLQTVSGGNATTTFAYDSLGQVLFSATVGDINADTLLRQAFTYDALGRVVGLSERVQGDTATYAYAYDAAGRLSEVRTGGVVTQAYTYDLNGNRTRVVTASQTLTAAYDAQDRLLNNGTATYVHAATGERTLTVVGPDTTRYRYDPFGNLRDVWLPSTQGGAHVQYEVDPQQRRTARLVNGVVTNRWLYQSQLAIAAEVDSVGNPVRTYVYGAHVNVPELMTTPSGQTFRFVTDQLGSVRLVMDALADTVVQRLDYDAYGRVVRDTKPGFQPFAYAGGEYEPLTGLVRFGARDYDAETGRWTAKDPAGFLGQDENLYAYAGGSPVGDTDPSGLTVLNPRHYVVSDSVMRALNAFNRLIGCDRDILITGGDRPRSSVLGARSGSLHTRGLAADIRVPGQRNLQTANQAARSGLFNGVGWYEEGYQGENGEGPHVHVDLRAGPPARWGYSASGEVFHGSFPAFPPK